MPTKSFDTPLAEIVLRRYEKPYHLADRELVRKLCLSLGILSPGDSRDVIVDVLHVLLDARTEQKMLSSDEVRDAVISFRKEEGLDDSGTAASNIRRQIRRLREIFLVEKVKNDYRIAEFATTTHIFEDKLERYMIPSIMERIKDYLEATDKAFATKEEKNDKH